MLTSWVVLVVERGGRIVAEGSASAPITFRSNATDDGRFVSWGGVVIMGSAPVSLQARPALFGGGYHSYPFGGGDRNASSGVLCHTRVIGARRGIALHGVGSASEVDYCEAAFSETDGVELDGGTVNVRHLSSIFAASAAIRVCGGYQGKGQFLFAMLGANGRNGIAVVAGGNGTVTHPRFLSLTVIGGGPDGKPGSLLSVSQGAGGTFGNTLLLHGTTLGLEVCADVPFSPCGSTCPLSEASASAPVVYFSSGSFVFDAVVDLLSCNTGVRNLSSRISAAVPSVDPELVHVLSSCLNYSCISQPDTVFDPMPSADSRACHGIPGVASDDSGFFDPVECSGAFGFDEPQQYWLAGLSAISPRPLGTDHGSAMPLIVPMSSGVSLTVQIPPSSADVDATLAQPGRRRALQALPGFLYDKTQCISSGFAGLGSAFWIRIPAAMSGDMLLSTCSIPPIGFDTDLAVFDAAGTQLACNGDGPWQGPECQNLYSQLQLSAVEGQVYLVAIGSHSGQLGANVTFSATFPAPPSPPLQPPPTMPPVPLLNASQIQVKIDQGSTSQEVVVVDIPAGVIELWAPIVIHPRMRVVIRGMSRSSSDPSVISGSVSQVQLFFVESTAELYVSNLQLVGGRSVRLAPLALY